MASQRFPHAIRFTLYVLLWTVGCVLGGLQLPFSTMFIFAAVLFIQFRSKAEAAASVGRREGARDAGRVPTGAAGFVAQTAKGGAV